jgi:hypothetical protein
MRGGIEAIYDHLARPTGLLSFAPTVVAPGPMFLSRQRARLAGAASIAPPVAESELPDIMEALRKTFYASSAASSSSRDAALVKLSTPKTTSANVDPGSSPQ